MRNTQKNIAIITPANPKGACPAAVKQQGFFAWEQVIRPNLEFRFSNSLYER
jgi:hypothetical protein